MKARIAFVASAGLLAALAGAGCGRDGDAVPTPEELAAHLLAPHDLAGAWSVSVVDEGADPIGVVTDEMQETLPRLELCSDASEDARTAASGLDWDAFVQLGIETADPIGPPDDQTGHMIFLQQYLAAADADDAAASFDLLRQGAEACLGEIEADGEGPGFAETMAVPELGDDSFGVLTTVQEAGGWAEWRLHQVVVRDGPVLMALVVTDIRAGDGVEPYFTTDDIGDIALTAVGKLGDEAPTLANPASQYCVAEGGRLDIVDEPGGQVGYCELPDGRRIEEWEYYRSQTTASEP